MQPNEIASGRWQQLLPALGVDARFLQNKHGPCPICGGKDRFRFDDKNGRGSWICNQCGAGDGYKLLQQVNGWSFKDAVTRVRSLVGSVEAAPVQVEQLEARKMSAILRVWNESAAAADGDPVWRYLMARVGFVPNTPALRYHPKLSYRHDSGEVSYHPAMVAKVSDPQGLGVSLHRTYLTHGGAKASVPSQKKLMPGKSLEGAAVRLFEHAECLGVAEGIETAIAAHSLFEMPVWAVISSSVMKSFTPPAGVTKVRIFGDNDPKHGGAASAWALAHRLACAGIECEVSIPATSGWDWADELRHA